MNDATGLSVAFINSQASLSVSDLQSNSFIKHLIDITSTGSFKLCAYAISPPLVSVPNPLLCVLCLWTGIETLFAPKQAAVFNPAQETFAEMINAVGESGMTEVEAYEKVSMYAQHHWMRATVAGLFSGEPSLKQLWCLFFLPNTETPCDSGDFSKKSFTCPGTSRSPGQANLKATYTNIVRLQSRATLCRAVSPFGVVP